MSTQSLNGVVTGSFIRTLAQAAREASSSSGSNPFRPGASSQTSLSGSLRIGAQTYGAAVQGLNSAISFLNVSRGSLEKLGSITDELLSMAEQATRRGTSEQVRRGLDNRFKKLAGDFQKIVDNTKVGDNKILTVEGIAEIFTAVGLDKETATSIADVFSKFLTPKEDDALASEEVKGQRPIVIPAGAFATRPSDTEYQLRQISSEEVTGSAAISQLNSVYGSVDGGSGMNAAYVTSAGGTQTLVDQSGLINFMGVDDVSGYSVIESSLNLAGDNDLGYSQLYLVDETGQVLSQLTENGTATLVYQAAALSTPSGGSVSVAFMSYDSNINESVISHGIFDTTGGVAPSITAIDTVSFGSFTGVTISRDGNYLAYEYNDGGGNYSLTMSDQSGSLQDMGAYLAPSFYGFDSGEYMTIATSDDGVLYDVYIGQWGVGLSSQLLDDVKIDRFATMTGAFAIYSSEDQAITVYESQEGGGEITSYNVGASATISGISISQKNPNSGDIDIGILGALPDFNGNSQQHLYRLSKNEQATTGRRLVRESEAATPLFDDTNTIRTRAGAYRMVTDLKELKEQITANLKAIDGAVEVVQKNVSLVRETGLALLELSGQIKDSADAEEVARQVRQRIRSNAGAALSQAENLQPIAVAALTLGIKSLFR